MIAAIRSVIRFFLVASAALCVIFRDYEIASVFLLYAIYMLIEQIEERLR